MSDPFTLATEDAFAVCAAGLTGEDELIGNLINGMGHTQLKYVATALFAVVAKPLLDVAAHAAGTTPEQVLQSLALAAQNPDLDEDDEGDDA